MKPPYLTSPDEIAYATEKPWLTQRECLAYIGVSKATLARWRMSGLLAYSKIGQLLFYRREDIDALLASQNQRPLHPQIAA